MEKKANSAAKPQIETVTPRAAIAGGEIAVSGSGFTLNGNLRPRVRLGEKTCSLMLCSANRVILRVPEGAVASELTIDNGAEVSAPAAVAVGACIAENLHPVANPVVDADGNIFTTFSGSRGQKVPVSIYKIDRLYNVKSFLTDLMNPTGLAFDRAGNLYASSRMEGTIYQISAEGRRSVYAEGMGVATGIAFDDDENLYVGDRSGTIFKINSSRQIFVFATLEPSVAAYHLAFGQDKCLYVTGPTTSSFDHVFRITPSGEVTTFYRGLGRPQGLAFDVEGNLYVAASLGGQRGVVRVPAKGRPEVVISGHGIVGLAFTARKTMILASNNSLYEIKMNIEGKPLLPPLR